MREREGDGVLNVRLGALTPQMALYRQFLTDAAVNKSKH